jgi:hypothetical protein
MSLRLERASIDDVPWPSLDAQPQRLVWQTRAWLEFLVETQGIKPIAARVADGSDEVGWFTGGIVRRFGFPILGSPMRGWSTPAIGFDLVPGADRTAAFARLRQFAFDELRCVHLELADRQLLDDAEVPEGFVVANLDGFELDIDADDDALMARFTSHGRRDVRRALRNGIVVSEVDPLAPGDFAEEYHEQLRQASAKRGVVPTYGVDRVHALIRHLAPTDRLVLLRATTADGALAATGIFPGQPAGTAEFWGIASERQHQHLLPNEALMWSALRTWRDRGALRLNFGGGGTYKAKYGGTPHHLPWVRTSRFGALESARSAAKRLERSRRHGIHEVRTRLTGPRTGAEA